MSFKKLEALIDENNGYITTKEAMNRGIHRQYLSLFVKEGKLIRVANGIYQTPDVWNDFLFSFQRKKAHLVYSHITALYLHGYSDREPIKYDVTIPSGFNTKQFKHKDIKIFTIKKELFELGIVKIKTSFGNEVLVYDIERTLCDLFRSKQQDINLVIEALKAYGKSINKDIRKLIKYAKLLRVERKIRTYLEVLL